MLLQRACLLRAALGRLPREVALNTVCSQRLGGFLDDLCREGFLEQIIRFRYATASQTTLTSGSLIELDNGWRLSRIFK
jgi:hypothetical protein